MATFRMIDHLEGKNLEEADSGKQALGDRAIWSVSSAKSGSGVACLRFVFSFSCVLTNRDNNLDTFWQSDGDQPHFINIQFHKKMLLEVRIPPIIFSLSSSLASL